MRFFIILLFDHIIHEVNIKIKYNIVM